jgi:hypothetical protein
MKRIALAVVLAAFALAPAAVAAGTLTGTFKTTIKGSKQFGGFLNGTWTLKLRTGHYKVLHNGKLAVKGIDTVADHVITFTDTGGSQKCKSTGQYKYKLRGGKLRFTKVRDTCAGRPTVLKHTFTKVK